LLAGKIPVIDQGHDTIGGYTDDEDMAFDGELPVILFGDHTRSLKYVVKRFAVGAEGVKILRPCVRYFPKFFYYLLRSLQIPSRGYSRHFQFLRKFHLPLAPDEQQKSIVAEIEKQFSRLDEAVANLKRVKANLKRYKASVLKAAVEGKLTEDWRKQHPDVEPASKLLERILAERRAKWKGNGTYKEPDSLDTSNLPELPDSWCWANLEQIKLFSLYGPRFSSDDYATNGPLVLRTSDISESGKVRQDTAPRLSLTADEVSKYRLERGDLLITRTGSLGTLAVFNDAVEAIPGAYLIQYRMGAPFETVQYIFHFFKSPVGQKQLIGGGAGVGRPNLNAPTIEAISIPLPSLAEQMLIVAEVERRLSVIENLEAAVDANLTRADRLRQSILSKAFSGNLGRS
jgi:type I restriction enzyme S subunit